MDIRSTALRNAVIEQVANQEGYIIALDGKDLSHLKRTDHLEILEIAWSEEEPNPMQYFGRFRERIQTFLGHCRHVVMVLTMQDAKPYTMEDMTFLSDLFADAECNVVWGVRIIANESNECPSILFIGTF